MSSILFVVYAVVFSRKNNENSNSAMDPVCLLNSPEGQAIDLNAKGSFCVSADFDMLTECPLYAVKDVVLPAWLSFAEYLGKQSAYTYAWGRGMDPRWSEAWQRGLIGLSSAEQLACIKLLNTKKFRSSFRQSMRDQLVHWLENPSERKYQNPFSPRQWDCLVDAYTVREAKQADSNTYYHNRYHSARGVGEAYLKDLSPECVQKAS